MKKELLISLRNRMRRGGRGFTLIELMVVIVILGILEARQTKARIMIEGIETALKLYRLDNGFYPTTEQGLRALVESSTIQPAPRNWREGGYLEKGKVPKDPWGNDFVYLCPGTQGEMDLVSYGADGQPGGEGKNKDITNWSQD
jgi:general secretion pathway protein G